MQLRRHNDGFQLDVSETELLALQSVLNETLNALEDWEFHTRTGVERTEMRATQSDLSEARRKLGGDA